MTIFYCGRRETAGDWEVKSADFVVVLGDKEGGVLAEYREIGV